MTLEGYYQDNRIRPYEEGFLVPGEFRRDWSDERFFTRPEPGALSTHQNTLLAGLVWWFGNKSGVW